MCDSQGFKTLGKEPKQSCLFVQSLATSLQIQAALFSLVCVTHPTWSMGIVTGCYRGDGNSQVRAA